MPKWTTPNRCKPCPCNPKLLKFFQYVYIKTGCLLTYGLLLALLYTTCYSLQPSVASLPECQRIILPSQNTSSATTRQNFNSGKTVQYALECRYGEALSVILFYGFSFLIGSVFGRMHLPELLGYLISGLTLRNIGVFIAQEQVYFQGHTPDGSYPVSNVTNETLQQGFVIRDPLVQLTAILVVDPEVSAILRQIALAVILSRAGLGLQPSQLRKVFTSVFLLSCVPCFTETIALTIFTRFLIGWPWIWGVVLGFVCAAVSPAIIVPYMVGLERKKLGVAEGIPTLVVAAASLDDVVAITGFGVALAVALSTGESLVATLFQGPVEALIGIVFGFGASLILCLFPPPKVEHSHFLRATLLGCLAVTCIIGSVAVRIPGAGALGCLTLTFLVATGWRAGYPWCLTSDYSSASTKENGDQYTMEIRKQNSEDPMVTEPDTDEARTTVVVGDAASPDDIIVSSEVTPKERGRECLHSMREALATLWWFVQPVLFCLIGAEVDLSRLSGKNTGYGILCIMMALVARFAASLLATLTSKLNMKERLFIGFAWLPKATVQAAIGPVALDTARRMNAPAELIGYAEQILNLAALCILITAPLGAILIISTAPRLLRRDESTEESD